MSDRQLHDTMIIELYKYVDQIFPGKSSMLFMSSRKAKQVYLPADAELHIHTGHIYLRL